MTINLGVVMDPIATIHYKKDSTFAMLFEARQRGFDIYYFEQKDLFLRNGVAFGQAKRLQVFEDPTHWYAFQSEKKELPLAELDVILMRKDPPFNEEYIYTTYLLEYAERLGTLIINRPQALRDANEKFFATQFPMLCPATLITRDKQQLWDFWHEHQEIVCKPLSGMGGTSVFRLKKGDVNANEIFATLTQHGEKYVMAQQFIPEIKAGDKRILLIDGVAIDHALARVPQGNDWRGNLVMGAKGVVQALSKRDREICDAIGPELKKRGLYFVGIDIIGNYLTEINVTSPTGIRELDAGAKINVSAKLIDFIETKLSRRETPFETATS